MGNIGDKLPDAKVLVCVIAVGQSEACMLNHPLRPRTKLRNLPPEKPSARVAEDWVEGLGLSFSTYIL